MRVCTLHECAKSTILSLRNMLRNSPLASLLIVLEGSSSISMNLASTQDSGSVLYKCHQKVEWGVRMRPL